MEIVLSSTKIDPVPVRIPRTINSAAGHLVASGNRNSAQPNSFTLGSQRSSIRRRPPNVTAEAGDGRGAPDGGRRAGWVPRGRGGAVSRSTRRGVEYRMRSVSSGRGFSKPVVSSPAAGRRWVAPVVYG